MLVPESFMKILTLQWCMPQNIVGKRFYPECISAIKALRRWNYDLRCIYRCWWAYKVQTVNHCLGILKSVREQQQLVWEKHLKNYVLGKSESRFKSYREYLACVGYKLGRKFVDRSTLESCWNMRKPTWCKKLSNILHKR